MTRTLLRFGNRFLIGALSFGLACSVLLNSYLVVRIRTVLAESSRISEAVVGGLDVGQHIARLVVTDQSGVGTELNNWEGSQETVLYVMQPSCVWCIRNESQIRFLAEKSRERYRFIGLTLTEDGLAAYLRAHPLPFPVYVISSDSAKGLGRVSTPETIVVSRAGLVLKVWTGAFLDENRRSMNKFFSVNLQEVDPSS
jgi:hypothetical protein